MTVKVVGTSRMVKELTMAVLKERIQENKKKKSVLPFLNTLVDLEMKRETSHGKRVTNVMALGKAAVLAGRRWWVTRERAALEGRR